MPDPAGGLGMLVPTKDGGADLSADFRVAGWDAGARVDEASPSDAPADADAPRDAPPPTDARLKRDVPPPRDVMHDQLVVEADAAQDIPVGPIGPTEGDPFDAAATAPDLPPDLVSAPDIVATTVPDVRSVLTHITGSGIGSGRTRSGKPGSVDVGSGIRPQPSDSTGRRRTRSGTVGSALPVRHQGEEGASPKQREHR